MAFIVLDQGAVAGEVVLASGVDWDSFGEDVGDGKRNWEGPGRGMVWSFELEVQKSGPEGTQVLNPRTTDRRGGEHRAWSMETRANGMLFRGGRQMRTNCRAAGRSGHANERADGKEYRRETRERK